MPCLPHPIFTGVGCPTIITGRISKERDPILPPGRTMQVWPQGWVGESWMPCLPHPIYTGVGCPTITTGRISEERGPILPPRRTRVIGQEGSPTPNPLAQKDHAGGMSGRRPHRASIPLTKTMQEGQDEWSARKEAWFNLSHWCTLQKENILLVSDLIKTTQNSHHIQRNWSQTLESSPKSSKSQIHLSLNLASIGIRSGKIVLCEITIIYRAIEDCVKFLFDITSTKSTLLDEMLDLLDNVSRSTSCWFMKMYYLYHNPEHPGLLYIWKKLASFYRYIFIFI